MGLFKKKGPVIDLTEKYRKQQEQLKEIQSENNSSQNPMQNSSEHSGNLFGFFGNAATDNSSVENSIDSNDTVNPEEKRRRLAKRLKEMTDKLEDLSNQIYHLQQRIEVLERKASVNQL